MRPMLATRGTTVPSGPDWVHEVKWDGMRVLAQVRAGKLRVTSRNENDVTAAFPELGGLIDVAGGRDVLLDGEVVAFTDGVPAFGALVDRIHTRSARKAEAAAAVNPATLLAFDLVGLDGLDLTSLALSDRRTALESLEVAGPHWQVPPTYEDGQALFEATSAQGLEGVVSKRLSSRYRFGQRSEDWLKFPHRPTGSYVVGGWRPEAGSSARLGAVLVGEMTPEGLLYRGRVGSGVAGRAAVRLAGLLRPAGSAPFLNEVPPEDSNGTHWVEPRVVVEVTSLGLTPQRRLRQPAYVGVRADLAPADLLDLEGGVDA